MTMENIRDIIGQAKEVGTVTSVYFEGGEPFLYYPILVFSVEEAVRSGFEAGFVSNAYWATALEDAVLWLEPLSGKVEKLSISTDLFHYDERISQQAKVASSAAQELGMEAGLLTILESDEPEGGNVVGQLPIGESTVMHRGRAAEKLVEGVPRTDWTTFIECPYEELREPDRLHIDPLGYVHICQGITIGNVYSQRLVEICEEYDPDAHPVAGPLLAGGPAELVRRYDLEHDDAYVDACHICYDARLKLRERFPDQLSPDQMYGVVGLEE
jgi:MoaA/NifB/PqqE/SkfB family radical SAM enzyme